MRRLLLAAVAAVAVVTPTTAHADHYWRDCGGVVDYECYGFVCSTDCWFRDCLVWVDPLHDPFTAVCVRPVG